jgi:hypothetical protein
MEMSANGVDPNQPLVPSSRYQRHGARGDLLLMLKPRGLEMFRRKGSLSSAGRGLVAAVVGALAVSVAEPPMAAASSIDPATKGLSAAAPSGGATDVSARRRHYHRGGNAAGLAIMGMMIGTMGAAIAAQQRRDAYYDYYGYYGPPPAYYGPPVYGYGPYYGRRVYRYYPY